MKDLNRILEQIIIMLKFREEFHFAWLYLSEYSCWSNKRLTAVKVLVVTSQIMTIIYAKCGRHSVEK